MEPTNWGLYNNSYYGGDRQHPISSHTSREDLSGSRRRSTNLGTFLPPVPPGGQSSSSHSLPPVSSAYGSGYHSSSPSQIGMAPAGAASPSLGQGPGPSGPPPPMHMTPALSYSSHVPPSQPMGGHYYPVQPPPATMSSFPPTARPTQPHGYSPRIPTGYPTASPVMTTLSPLSPSNHLVYTGQSSSGQFPPNLHPTNAKMETPLEKKRRTNSAGSSWEGSGALSATTTATTDANDKADAQPWGMPQEQYKALNPRDKKQVRNRIGARRFRAKRKDYVSTLEQTKKENEVLIKQLQAELTASRHTINELRARLHLPPIPLPPPTETGLGLDVESQQQQYPGALEGGRDHGKID